MKSSTQDYYSLLDEKYNPDKILESLIEQARKGDKFVAFQEATFQYSATKDERFKSLILYLLNDYEVIYELLSNLRIILHLPNIETFYTFIEKYEKEIIEFLDKTIITVSQNWIIDDLSDDLDPIYYPKDENYWEEFDPKKTILSFDKETFRIPPIVDGEICYHFFKHFKDHLTIGMASDPGRTAFNNMKEELVIELFQEEYKKKNYLSSVLFEELICRMSKYEKIIDIEMDELMFQRLFSRRNSYTIKHALDYYSNKLLEKLEVPDSIDTSEFNIINFLKAYKYLKDINKNEIKNHKLFNQIKDIYIIYIKNVILKNQDESIILTNEQEKIIELVLLRQIKNGDIIKLFSFKNIQSIIFYFKTNIIDSSLYEYSWEQIDSINIKHFKTLFDKFVRLESLNNSPSIVQIYYFMEDKNRYNSLIVDLLLRYDYDFLESIDDSKIYQMSNILLQIDKNRLKNPEYKNKFQTLIKEILTTNYIDLKNISINIFIHLFNFMFDNNYKNISASIMKKRIDSLTYLLLPNNYNLEEYLEKLNLVVKGEPYIDKIEGIVLYNKYRLRKYSSIPEISGSISNIQYELVDMHSPSIISNGIDRFIYPDNKFYSSCLTPNGKAKSCLSHGAINPNGRFLKISSSNKMIGYAWIWRQGDVLVIDNLELTEEYLSLENNEENIYLILLEFANKLINETKDNKRPIKLVVIGKNKIDVGNKYLDKHEKVLDIFKETFKPSNSENLYLTDSSECQIIIAGSTDNLDLSDLSVDDYYKYKRKEVKRFDEVEGLRKELESIYFDYCMLKNIKREQIPMYKDGYIAEDWYVGIKEDGSKDIITRTDDEDIYEEIESYLKINIQRPEIFIPKVKEKEELNYLLNVDNYEIKREDLQDYFNYLKSLGKIDCISSYFHTPVTINKIYEILIDNAITSKVVGRRDTSHFGSNGLHFICVAKIPSQVYQNYCGNTGFGFTKDLCIFEGMVSSDFTATDYPIRNTGLNGELQVRDIIKLDKANAIYVPYSCQDTLPILYMTQETVGNNLPLFLTENYQEIDKDVLRKIIKLK